MAPKIILFDFDGTLADSFTLILAAGNRLAATYGYPSISESEALALRSQGIRQIIQQSNVPLHRLPAWMRQMKKELQKETAYMQPQSGLTKALSSLKETKIPLGIVTSNSRDNVHGFLDNNGWTGWFAHVETGSNLFGKSRLIARLLDRSGFTASEAIYVGDEVRDVEAARKAGVSSVAVTWGFNDRNILTRTRPDHLIDHPEELLHLVAADSSA